MRNTGQHKTLGIRERWPVLTSLKFHHDTKRGSLLVTFVCSQTINYYTSHTMDISFQLRMDSIWFRRCILVIWKLSWVPLCTLANTLLWSLVKMISRFVHWKAPCRCENPKQRWTLLAHNFGNLFLSAKYSFSVQKRARLACSCSQIRSNKNRTIHLLTPSIKEII